MVTVNYGKGIKRLIITQWFQKQWTRVPFNWSFFSKEKLLSPSFIAERSSNIKKYFTTKIWFYTSSFTVTGPDISSFLHSPSATHFPPFIGNTISLKKSDDSLLNLIEGNLALPFSGVEWGGGRTFRCNGDGFNSRDASSNIPVLATDRCWRTGIDSQTPPDFPPPPPPSSLSSLVDRVMNGFLSPEGTEENLRKRRLPLFPLFFLLSSVSEFEKLVSYILFLTIVSKKEALVAHKL